MENADRTVVVVVFVGVVVRLVTVVDIAGFLLLTGLLVTVVLVTVAFSVVEEIGEEGEGGGDSTFLFLLYSAMNSRKSRLR